MHIEFTRQWLAVHAGSQTLAGLYSSIVAALAMTGW